jgi:uncharacterized protein
MNAHTERLMLQGAAGRVEALRDLPEGGSQRAIPGVAIICHPHPLFGGTMDNKVVQTLARAFVQAGWTALRFNFRGVGRSDGVYDEGRGEADDLRVLIKQLVPAGSVLALAGFSFGSFVASQVVAEAAHSHDLQKIVLIGTAASRFAVSPIPAQLHEKLLVVHGEQDDTVPLASVMDWARPQLVPVTVVPGGGHFFHGQLPLLRGLVARHLVS